MSTHPQILLQIKIFDLLRLDATLIALLANGAKSVFDNVPENPDFPYIVIGDDTFSDWSAHDFSGFVGTATIRVWSQKSGRKECKGIQNRIYTLLQRVKLGLVGFADIQFRLGAQNIIKDPDGKTHQGIQTFNFTLGGN